MRRLLIKLVALETMLVGWLSYWIFLIYANNPSVSAGLANQFSRFPQLSFTTVDLAVLVIIAAFAVALAFKFHRGLRPGIRLERALQMLENLMKRNLVLEAQVAELRIEKVEKIPPKIAPSSSSIPVPGLRGPSFASIGPPLPGEPRPGSWEKAFRTPLEAGPSTTKVSSSNLSEVPFQRETGIPPTRIEETPPTASLPKPVLIQEKTVPPPIGTQTEDKLLDKAPPALSPSSSAGWEDSPKYVGETFGILNPSSSSKKAGPSSSDSLGLRQPYIPVPAPRMTPSSVIVGPMNQKPSSPTRQTPKPIVRPSFSAKASSKESPPLTPMEVKVASPPIIIDRTDSSMDLKPSEPPKLAITTGDEETKEKAAEKPPVASKKKPSHEED